MANYLLFDLDGTLTNPQVGITKSVQYALQAFGIEVENPDVLCPFIGPPLKESFMRFYDFSEQDALLAVAKYREYFTDKGIYENIIYDGVANMLEKLKQEDKTLILATSKPTVFAQVILQHFSIATAFTFVGGSELDGSRTRKSEVISYVLQENNITDLQDVVMIGDREHDIIGAREVGIDSIGVLYGFGDYKELSEAKATMIVDSVDELQEILLKAD